VIVSDSALRVNADLEWFGTSFPEVFRKVKNGAANFANKHESKNFFSNSCSFVLICGQFTRAVFDTLASAMVQQ
jgi:hypothetical protein